MRAVGLNVCSVVRFFVPHGEKVFVEIVIYPIRVTAIPASVARSVSTCIGRNL